MTLDLSPASALQGVLEPFLLRRVKAEVAVDLPKKTELLVYHGMSALQKKYYKAFLMKDLGEAVVVSILGAKYANSHNIKTSLLPIPYLFYIPTDILTELVIL